MKKIIIVCLAVCLLLCGIAGIPEAKAEAKCSSLLPLFQASARLFSQQTGNFSIFLTSDI